MIPELSVVLPVFNEFESLDELLRHEDWDLWAEQLDRLRWDEAEMAGFVARAEADARAAGERARERRRGGRGGGGGKGGRENGEAGEGEEEEEERTRGGVQSV